MWMCLNQPVHQGRNTSQLFDFDFAFLNYVVVILVYTTTTTEYCDYHSSKKARAFEVLHLSFGGEKGKRFIHQP